MPCFAELDKDGTVLRVIVIDAQTLQTGRWGDPQNWIETFENGSNRKNYAGAGFTYDKTRDAFIAPKPSDAAALDEQTCKWIESAPIRKRT